MAQENIVRGYKISKNETKVDKTKIEVISKLLPLAMKRSLGDYLAMHVSTNDSLNIFLK